MTISFTLGKHAYKGTAVPFELPESGKTRYVVRLEDMDKPPFHIYQSETGQWRGEDIEDMDLILAAGSEIEKQNRPGKQAGQANDAIPEITHDNQTNKVEEGTTEYPPIELHHHFVAPAENVFNAWTDPVLISRWMFKGNENDIIQVINKLEQNGAFSVVKKNEQGEFVEYFGTYREISRPNLLSFSLESPGRFNGVSSVVIRIMPTEFCSHLTLLQTGVHPAVFNEAWRKMFEKLEGILAG